MISFPIPAKLNGETLRSELAAAGVVVGQYDIVLVGETIQFPTLDTSQRSKVMNVLTKHKGENSAPKLTVEQRLEALETRLRLLEERLPGR